MSTIEEDFCVTSAFFNNAIFGRIAGGLLFRKATTGRRQVMRLLLLEKALLREREASRLLTGGN